MSDATDGRGLVSDEFDDDEIEWDDANDESPADDSDESGLSPIEAMVGESEEVVVPEDDEESDEDEDEDEDDDK